MKGKVENTIPQRQYENTRITYYFENDSERKEAIEKSIQDCIKYSGLVPKLLEKTESTEIIISGVKWRKDRLGKWVYDAKTETTVS
jgi:hypothetical protein